MPRRKPRGLSIRRPPRRNGRTRRLGGQHAARNDGDLARARNGGLRRLFVRRAGQMDGGRRFSRSLKERLHTLLSPAFSASGGSVWLRGFVRRSLSDARRISGERRLRRLRRRSSSRQARLFRASRGPCLEAGVWNLRVDRRCSRPPAGPASSMSGGYRRTGDGRRRAARHDRPRSRLSDQRRHDLRRESADARSEILSAARHRPAGIVAVSRREWRCAIACCNAAREIRARAEVLSRSSGHRH